MPRWVSRPLGLLRRQSARLLATLRSMISWVFSWKQRRAQRRQQEMFLVLLQVIPQLLLPVHQQLEKLQHPPLPLPVVQDPLLPELRELLLEVLQEMQPSPEQALAQLIGQPQLTSSTPSSVAS